MGPIRKLDSILETLENSLVIMIFIALTGAVAFNILTRNLFNVSFQGVIEIVPSLVLWLALLGSTLALKHQRHIRLELVLRFLPEKTRTPLRLAASIFGIVVMGLLLIASIQFVKNEIQIFGAWGTTALIFPVFFLLSVFRYTLFALEYLHE